MAEDDGQAQECAWCEAPATTVIYTVGRPGLKKTRKAPVCDEHEEEFLRRGCVSQRSYEAEQVEKARKRSQQARAYFARRDAR